MEEKEYIERNTELIKANMRTVFETTKGVLKRDGFHSPMVLVCKIPKVVNGFSPEEPVPMDMVAMDLNRVFGMPNGKDAAAYALRKMAEASTEVLGYFMVFEAFAHKGKADNHTSKQVMEGEISCKELYEQGDPNVVDTILVNASFRGPIDMSIMSTFEKDDEGNVTHIEEPEIIDSSGTDDTHGRFSQLFKGLPLG
jgi:hypothetical protein